MQPKHYQLNVSYDHLRIEDKISRYEIGRVDTPTGKYVVRNSDDEIVATVGTMEEAVPALLAYYEAHPFPWKQASPTSYEREDWLVGSLYVLQEPLGYWSVYRAQTQILLHEGRPAAFRTADEAKAVAALYAHEPEEEPSDDGYEWLNLDHDQVERRKLL